MNYSNWKIEECPTDKLKMFTDAGYPALLAALLSVRGLGSVQEAKSFLDGGAELLCDPLLMKDMDRAAARIRRALSMRETVAVYGDYDVDGITSTCLLTDWLRSRGLECYPYIPDRIGEGYGLNSAAIDTLHGKGVSLIISVDCGTPARSLFGYMQSSCLGSITAIASGIVCSRHS